MAQHNYRVITAAGDLALEGDHNYILILTPERLLYLLISRPQLQIDHLFIDEAHKILNSTYYNSLLKASKKVKNVILLSATPIVHDGVEYLRLVKLLNPQKYNNTKLHIFISGDFNEKNICSILSNSFYNTYTCSSKSMYKRCAKRINYLR